MDLKVLRAAVVTVAVSVVLFAAATPQAKAQDPINYKLDLIIANQQAQNDRIAALEQRVTALEGRGYSPSYSPPTAYQQPTYYPQPQYQPAYYAPQPVTPAYRYTPPVYPHEQPQSYSGYTNQAYAPGYYEAQVYATAYYRGQ